MLLHSCASAAVQYDNQDGKEVHFLELTIISHSSGLHRVKIWGAELIAQAEKLNAGDAFEMIHTRYSKRHGSFGLQLASNKHLSLSSTCSTTIGELLDEKYLKLLEGVQASTDEGAGRVPNCTFHDFESMILDRDNPSKLKSGTATPKRMLAGESP